jgi:hypothetical protein
VLVYLALTGTRDLQPRLDAVLRRAGVRVGMLDAAVEPKRREAWILRHQHERDVLLGNPELVKTGLDLYEFPTVVFYQVGYNLFTLRQAARRSWRIGQTQPVRVVYLAYRETMQAVALELIARKIAAALVVEGELPDGLTEFGQAQASPRGSPGAMPIHYRLSVHVLSVTDPQNEKGSRTFLYLVHHANIPNPPPIEPFELACQCFAFVGISGKFTPYSLEEALLISLGKGSHILQDAFLEANFKRQAPSSFAPERESRHRDRHAEPVQSGSLRIPPDTAPVPS